MPIIISGKLLHVFLFNIMKHADPHILSEYQFKPHRCPAHPAKQQPLQPLGTIQPLDIGEDDGRGFLALKAVKAVKGDLPLAPDLRTIGPISAGKAADRVLADPFTPPEW